MKRSSSFQYNLLNMTVNEIYLSLKSHVVLIKRLIRNWGLVYSLAYSLPMVARGLVLRERTLLLVLPLSPVHWRLWTWGWFSVCKKPVWDPIRHLLDWAPSSAYRLVWTERSLLYFVFRAEAGVHVFTWKNLGWLITVSSYLINNNPMLPM